MTQSSSNRAVSWAINIAVVLMVLAIPFGFGMALYTNNTSWFWLCAFLLIFLS